MPIAAWRQRQEVLRWQAARRPLAWEALQRVRSVVWSALGRAHGAWPAVKGAAVFEQRARARLLAAWVARRLP
jgi:hypothetical protein